MNTNNSLFITIVALLLFLNSMESVSSFQQCDSMTKYLENLYQRLVIRRIKDPGKRRNFTSSGRSNIALLSPYFHEVPKILSCNFSVLRPCVADKCPITTEK